MLPLPQAKRLTAKLENRIADDKEEETGTGEIDEEGSRLCGRVRDGAESSSGFFNANATLVLQFPSGMVKFEQISAEKGDSRCQTVVVLC
jgi:hypothetical protein